MSNLRKIDISGVGVFLDNEQFVALPKVFKDNNSLTMVSQKMVEYVMQKFEEHPEVQMTAENIIKFLSDYQKEESGIPQFAVLESYANECARGFKETHTALKMNIYTLVENLAKEINAATDKHLKNMGVSAILESEEKLGDTAEFGDMDEFDWDESVGDTSTLLDTLFIDTNVTKLENMQVQNCATMSNSLAMDVSDTLTIPDETKINMINRVVTECKYDSDLVTSALAILTDRPKYHQFMFTHFVSGAEMKPIDTCKLFSTSVQKFYRVMEDIGNTAFEIDDETGVELKSRAKNIMLGMDIMRYYLCCRRQYFKDSILLDTNLINKDLKETYLKDHTMADLHTYVRVIHLMKNVPIYQNGVSISSLDYSKERVQTEYAKYKEEIKMNKHVYKNRAQTLAVEEVIGNYLRNTDPTKVPAQYGNKQNYINQLTVMAKNMLALVHNNDGSVEDMLYKFTMDNLYNGTPEAKMFNAYQKEAMTAVAAVEHMPDAKIDPNLVEAKVCSKFITSFFINNFMK